MYRNYFVFCLTSWFIIFIFTVTGGVTVGSTPDDVPILERAIALYKSNVGKITTWQGKVIGELYEKGSPPASDKLELFGKPIKISEISFCDDIVTGNSLCIHRIIQNNTTEFHDEICTLFSDGLSYEISRYKDAKLDNNRKLGYESQLAIKAVTRKDLSRLLSTHFLPLEEADNKGYACFAMTGDIQLINQEPVDNLSSISVRQVNNILTVESTIKNIIGCARYSIDMERGGMPIECLATIDGKGFHWQCKLQNCDGIWIPEETSFVSINSDDTFYCYKYLWKENTINAKIPADTFSLNSLGVHRGTVVYDYRTGYEQILSDSEFPSMPQYYVEKIKRSPVAGIALVVAIIIAIITILAIIVRIVMRFYNKRKCNISEE